MIKTTSTKSGMRIVTVKAFGFYANVSFGKCATVTAYTAKQAARLATNDECNAAHRVAYRALMKATDNSLSYAPNDGKSAIYKTAYNRELIRLVTARLRPAKRRFALPAMPIDAFGTAACVVLAFTAYLSF